MFVGSVAGMDGARGEGRQRATSALRPINSGMLGSLDLRSAPNGSGIGHYAEQQRATGQLMAPRFALVTITGSRQVIHQCHRFV